MAKFFKVIVNIIIVVCILSVVALIVPPLVGVEENIAGPKMDTNLSQGTVVYGTKLPVAMTSAGDEIVYSGDEYLYVYRINEVDTENDEVTVVNEVSGEQSVLPISKSVTKKVLAVPFIGYIMIATGSKEGLAMLISAAVVLVLLALVAELCVKKAYPEEEEEEEEEEEYFSDIAKDMETGTAYEAEYNALNIPAQTAAASLAAEMSGTAEQMPAAQEQISEEISDVAEQLAAASQEAEMAEEKVTEERSAVMEEQAADGAGLLSVEETLAEEIPSAEEEDPEGRTIVIPSTEDKKPAEAAKSGAAKEDKKAADTAASAAKKKEESKEAEAVKKAEEQAPAAAAKKPEQTESFNSREMVEAFDNVPEDRSAASLNISDEEIPEVSNALVAALASTQVSRSERIYQQQAQPAEETPADPADEIELAIPVLSAEEILDAAYAAGDDPGVSRDEVTGVTLVDFSDCIG